MDDTGIGRVRNRWLVVCWLAVALVFLALNAASVSTAQAHPASHPMTDAISAELFGSVSDLACCDDLEGHHAAEACSFSGHCSACATSGIGADALAPSPTGRLRLKGMSLPAGLTSLPAGHPPKLSHPI